LRFLNCFLTYHLHFPLNWSWWLCYLGAGPAEGFCDTRDDSSVGAEARDINGAAPKIAISVRDLRKWLQFWLRGIKEEVISCLGWRGSLTAGAITCRVCSFPSAMRDEAFNGGKGTVDNLELLELRKMRYV